MGNKFKTTSVRLGEGGVVTEFKYIYFHFSYFLSYSRGTETLIPDQLMFLYLSVGINSPIEYGIIFTFLSTNITK